MTETQIDANLERLQNAVEEILELRAFWPASPERDARIEQCWREIKTASQEIIP